MLWNSGNPARRMRVDSERGCPNRTGSFTFFKERNILETIIHQSRFFDNRRTMPQMAASPDINVVRTPWISDDPVLIIYP